MSTKPKRRPVGRPRLDPGESEQIMARLPPDLRTRLDRARGQTPIAVVVREALELWLVGKEG